jgi:hypothetical protein
MTQVPEMVNEVSTFCEILRDLARKQETFSMDKVATRLSLDIIGRVTLYLSLPSRLWFESLLTCAGIFSLMHNKVRTNL